MNSDRVLARLQGIGLAGIRLAGRIPGKPLDVERVVQMLGMRLFARRFYGALIDANGASYADVDGTFGRIRSLQPEVWVREWRRTADRYAVLGRAAAADGRRHSAEQLLVKASTYYRFAEMSILADTPARQDLQQDCIDTYQLAGTCMDPPLQRISLRVGERKSVGYLRVPPTTDGPPPVVLIVPGLGMVKEHGDYPQSFLLERGIAAMTIDLPGQGENRGAFRLSVDDALPLIGSAIDFLTQHHAVNGQRLGVLGTSMGAAAAMLAAGRDRRIRALVEIAGFYYPSAWWDRFPPEIKEFLRYVVGAADDGELWDVVKPINLRGRVAEIACPLLVVHGTADQIIPFGESNLIYDEALCAKDRLTFDGGDHGCVNIGEARPLIGDWIARQLRKK